MHGGLSPEAGPGRRLPGRLNLALLAVASAAAAALVWAAAHARSAGTLLAAAVAFSFVNNTLFALLHESVHGLFHEDPRLNDAAGTLAAAWFPTSFSVQRAFHLTHHANNRSQSEQFDYLRPGDVRWLKYAQWYAILTGFYWAFPPLFCLVHALWPRAARARWLGDAEATVGGQTAAACYLAAVREVPVARVRAETLWAVVFQAGLWRLCGFDARAWLACYAAFAVNWSALQYADHAFSPLDARRGAWNLRVNPLVRALFLNYHHHLAHHLHPGVSWRDLPRHVDPAEARPSFLSIYLRMWRGPRPIAEAGPPAAVP
jgi:fatty acid desaturase